MNLWLIIFITPLTALLFLLVFVLLRRIILEKGKLMRSLNLKLLLIKFPPVYNESETNIQQVREKISLMEQLYSHLDVIEDDWVHSLLYGKPVFVLELTIPSVGEELSFYLAVPRRVVQAVEKLIQGIFPEAQIEYAQDYNIFNPHGETAGSYIKTTRNLFDPIRTYQKIEGDPMRPLTNSFTKLAQEGEGAAFQIVARPASSKWSIKMKERAKRIYEGKPLKSGGLIGFIEEVNEILNPEPKKPEEVTKRITPVEEERVRELETKASKPLFEANIRLICSAPYSVRAGEILGSLEAVFQQYQNPNGNELKPIRLTGKKLKDMAFKFSFRLFDEKQKVILDSAEMTSLFHFPNVLLEMPKIQHARAREAPPPPNLPREGLSLGYNVFRGEKTDIYFQDNDRRRHLYIVGQTGTGKSKFMEHMIIQDIQNGKGVCVIDPHGDMVERILQFVPRHRFQDVIYFNPGDVSRPLGLNMLEYDLNYPEQKTFIVNELLNIFNKLYNMSIAGGPAFEQYFRNSTLLVMEHPSSGNTLLEVARVLSNKEFRDYKLAHCKNPLVVQFWENAQRTTGEQSLANYVQYVTNKFDVFLSNDIMRPIIAQEKSAFNFREIIDNQRILLVNLSKGRLGDLNSSLIGLIIVGKILMASLSRVDIEEHKRKDFYLYIDEFQNVTTDSIATILSEARKYRLDLIITHQFIGQLQEEIKKAVFGNVGSIISFRIGADDAEFLARQFKPTFSEYDLMHLDNYNCYVRLLINGETSRPFSMKTYPPTEGDPKTAEIVKEISRIKYGRPREEIEADIRSRYR